MASKCSKMTSRVAIGVALLGFAGVYAQVTVNKAEGWLESAYAEWAPVSGGPATMSIATATRSTIS